MKIDCWKKKKKKKKQTKKKKKKKKKNKQTNKKKKKKKNPENHDIGKVSLTPTDQCLLKLFIHHL